MKDVKYVVSRPIRAVALTLTLAALLTTALFALLGSSAVAAGTTLEPGDIAIIGFNFDNPDEYAFVLLRDIDAGTTITFTDNGWYAGGGFRDTEGTEAWTAGADLPAGTVITRTPDSMSFSTGGDQIFAYQGPDSAPSFIYALNSSGTSWQSDTDNSNDSALPDGLTDGETAVALDEIDNAVYDVNNGTSGTKAELLNFISNKLNWEGSDSTRQAMPVGLLSVSAGRFYITKSAPEMVHPGEVFTYTIVATNDTGMTTTNTVITDALPADVDFVSASDGGALMDSGTVVSWTVSGDFPNGESVTRTFQVTAASSLGADIVNERYGVRAADWVTLTAGNPVTTYISPLDLTVSKAGPEYAVIGENVVYTITLHNKGVATATNVILTDTLPVSSTYVSDNSGVTPTETDDGVYVWDFGDVPSDTVRTFNLTVAVDAPEDGTLMIPLQNKVEASTDTEGDNPDNNSASTMATAYALTSIHDIQQVSDPATDDESSYNGEVVWVEGVVVAGTGEIGYAGSNFVIEHPDGGPWSGLMVYNDGVFSDVDEGDYVRLLGTVAEHYGMTEFDISAAPNAQQIISTGNSLPAPEVITTGLFATAVPTTAEPYESVLIEFQDAEVISDDLGFGEWSFDDGTGATRADDFGWHDGDLTYEPELGHAYEFIRGIGWYSYGDYKLEPRYDADIFLAPDLSITKTVEPEMAVPLGGVVTYTVTIANDGEAEAASVMMTDTLPSEVTFGGWVNQGSALLPDQPGETITWGPWSVPGGESYTFAFTATVTTDTAYYGSEVTNTVEFTSDNAGSGSDEATFAVSGSPVLELSKAVTPEEAVGLGDVVTYTLALANDGEAEATGIFLTDTLPSEVAFGSFATGTNVTPDYTDGVVTWSGDLPAGVQPIAIVFTATVTTDTAYYDSEVTNTVEFTSNNAGSGQAQAIFTTEGTHIYLPLVARNHGG